MNRSAHGILNLSMLSERPVAAAPQDPKRETFAVESRIHELNARFMKFLETNFKRLDEGGVPEEIVDIVADFWEGVPEERRERELAWLRVAFDTHIVRYGDRWPSPAFLEAVRLTRALLADPFEARELRDLLGVSSVPLVSDFPPAPKIPTDIRALVGEGLVLMMAAEESRRPPVLPEAESAQTVRPQRIPTSPKGVSWRPTIAPERLR